LTDFDQNWYEASVNVIVSDIHCTQYVSRPALLTRPNIFLGDQTVPS